jgi:pyrimidine operon attenuation protein/uracil phosphoribosyltransferase
MANDDAGPANHARATAPAAAPAESLLLDDAAIRRALMRIAHEIVEKNEDLSRLYLVGIPNGGVPLAKQLAANLREIVGVEALVGVLDTTLYRDDLVSSGARPRLRRTEMPSSVDERVVILVDDVASTGRTIRAAMDALMDKIDYVGKNIPTQRGDRVQMRGPETALEVVLLRNASAARARDTEGAA